MSAAAVTSGGAGPSVSKGVPAAAPGGGLAFGFVEASVVANLRDIGNWKVRADAIENLQGAVACLYDVTPVMPHLADFVAFLRGLLADNNFKISLTTLQVFSDLVEKIGVALTPFVGTIVPTLVEKLGDNKIVVRQANAKVFNKLVDTVGPQPVLAVLATPLQHRSWRVREEVANVAILGLHTAGTRLDDDTLTALLPTLAHLATGDPISHVCERALDALAISHNTLGAPRLRYVLESVEGTHRAAGLTYATDDVLEAISTRLADPTPLPSVTADGLVEAPANRNLASATGGRRGLTSRGGPDGYGVFDDMSYGPPSGVVTPRAVSGYAPTRPIGSAIASPSPRRHLDTAGAALGVLGEFQPIAPSSDPPTNLLKRRTNRSPPRLDVGQNSTGIPRGARGSIDDPGPKSDVLPKGNDTWLNTPSESESPQMPLSAVPPERRQNALGVSTSLNALKRRSETRRAHSASSALLQRLGMEDAFPAPSENEKLPVGALKPSTGRKYGRRGPLAGGGDVDGGASSGDSDGSMSNIATPSSSLDASEMPPSPDPDRARMHILAQTTARETHGSRSSRTLRPNINRENSLGASRSAYGTRSGRADFGTNGDAAPSGLGNPITVPRVPSADTLWEDLEAVPAAERELRTALGSLQVASKAKHQELDWESQQRGLHMVRRLARHHSDLIAATLHQLVLCAVPAVESLRSQISKTAIVCTGEIITSLGRRCDAELEFIAEKLCRKCGDTGFLAGEADRAIECMVHSCSPLRVLAALTPCASLRSAAARARVAANIQLCLSAGGGARALQGAAGRDVLDRVGAVLAQLVDDGGVDCRAYAKRAVFDLASGASSEVRDMLRRMSDSSKTRRLREILESSKGPPPLPNPQLRLNSRVGPRIGTAGSGLRRETSGSSLRSEETGAPAPWLAPPDPVSPTGKHGGGMLIRGRAHKNEDLSRRHGGGGNEPAGETAAPPDELSEAIANMSRSDWRLRVDGVRSLSKVVLNQSRGTYGARSVSSGEVTAALDAIVPRLSDGNAKVAVESLQALTSMFPVFRDSAAPCLGTVVPALAGALGSTNDKVRQQGEVAVDSLIGSVDSALLVPWFCQMATRTTSRSRPMMLDRLGELAGAVHAVAKPQLLAKHVLPAAISALNDNRGEARAANHRLVRKLAALMGNEFYEHAATLAAGNQRRLAELVSTPPPSRDARDGSRY